MDCYDFTKKEIKEEFKKTEYGNKINKMQNVAVILTIFGLFALFYSSFAMEGIMDIRVQVSSLVLLLWCGYIDGKRDGAIGMYKNLQETNNKQTPKQDE